jgi:hypothetical protein
MRGQRRLADSGREAHDLDGSARKRIA